ncbi:hypothetical protein [Mesorhizobium sp.]|uniref:hypothetical protein n=1 Tax=Mesorhizobium sp. TaxID=1871066 RepID=UPI0012183C78|nr:hypothetical protein [Mesorhizobium sp.]TIN22704.1 MAG: hypothetical protein E5Y19_31295 [Mesorhizobium sp.]
MLVGKIGEMHLQCRMIISGVGLKAEFCRSPRYEKPGCPNTKQQAALFPKLYAVALQVPKMNAFTGIAHQSVKADVAVLEKPPPDGMPLAAATCEFAPDEFPPCDRAAIEHDAAVLAVSAVFSVQPQACGQISLTGKRHAGMRPLAEEQLLQRRRGSIIPSRVSQP